MKLLQKWSLNRITKKFYPYQLCRKMKSLEYLTFLACLNNFSNKIRYEPLCFIDKQTATNPSATQFINLLNNCLLPIQFMPTGKYDYKNNNYDNEWLLFLKTCQDEFYHEDNTSYIEKQCPNIDLITILISCAALCF